MKPTTRILSSVLLIATCGTGDEALRHLTVWDPAAARNESEPFVIIRDRIAPASSVEADLVDRLNRDATR